MVSCEWLGSHDLVDIVMHAKRGKRDLGTDPNKCLSTNLDNLETSIPGGIPSCGTTAVYGTCLVNTSSHKLDSYCTEWVYWSWISQDQWECLTCKTGSATILCVQRPGLSNETPPMEFFVRKGSTPCLCFVWHLIHSKRFMSINL